MSTREADSDEVINEQSELPTLPVEAVPPTAFRTWSDALEQVAKDRTTQGLPPNITDPVVLRQIAHLLGLTVDRAEPVGIEPAALPRLRPKRKQSPPAVRTPIVPSDDFGQEPESRPALWKINYRAGHVWVSPEIRAYGVPVRQSKQPGYTLRVDEVVHVHPSAHIESLWMSRSQVQRCAHGEPDYVSRLLGSCRRHRFISLHTYSCVEAGEDMNGALEHKPAAPDIINIRRKGRPVLDDSIVLAAATCSALRRSHFDA